jgi:hypothetical protein
MTLPMMPDEESIFLQSNPGVDADLKSIVRMSEEEQKQVLQKQEDGRTAFVAYMRSQGIVVVVVPMRADGNCLLRAFRIRDVFARMSLNAIRAMCIEQLANSEQFLHTDPEVLAILIGLSFGDDESSVSKMEYLDKMSKNSTPCDALMLKVLQEYSKTTVIVWHLQPQGGFEKVVHVCNNGGAGTDSGSEDKPVSLTGNCY